jgi:hypothetical protein
MSYVQTSSGYSPYYGEVLDPPECESDNPVTCDTCKEEFDADDDTIYEVDGNLVCSGCVERCVWCGETIHDEMDHSECAETC